MRNNFLAYLWWRLFPPQPTMRISEESCCRLVGQWFPIPAEPVTIPDLPGLRFAVHRDIADHHKWRCTELSTGLGKDKCESPEEAVECMRQNVDAVPVRANIQIALKLYGPTPTPMELPDQPGLFFPIPIQATEAQK